MYIGFFGVTCYCKCIAHAVCIQNFRSRSLTLCYLLVGSVLTTAKVIPSSMRQYLNSLCFSVDRGWRFLV